MTPAYGRNSDLNLIFWVRLNRFQTRLMRRLSNIISTYDLTMPQFSVLEALYHKGPLSVGEIRETRLITGGNITVIMANLEKKGLIKLEADCADRRRQIAELSPAGEDLIQKAFLAHLDELDGVLEALSPEEKIRMARLFKEIPIPDDRDAPNVD